MNRSEIVLSTVALTTVMMMSSLHFTSDVQAAETQVTVTSELNNDDFNPYGWVIDGDNHDYDQDIVISVGEVSDDDSDDSSNTQDNVYEEKLSVVSYTQKFDICVDGNLKISDLKIKMSDYNGRDYHFRFSNGKTTSDKFTELGTFTDTVTGYWSDQTFTLPITINVKEAEAPTIKGVHNIKCIWSGVPKSSFPVSKLARSGVKCDEGGKDYSKWLIDPNSRKLYSPEKLMKLGVSAVDCHGNKIPSKNIKVTGYNVYKYNKTQKITYSVTDSEGRTTTKTCNLYIDNGDRYYKSPKYLTAVKGGYLSESSYFDDFGSSYVEVKEKKVRIDNNDLGIHDKYYEAKNKPIRVNIGDKLKVVGYVVNPSNGKNMYNGDFAIKIVEYNGKQYYYQALLSNVSKAYINKNRDWDCSGIVGGALKITHGLYRYNGKIVINADCSVSNYIESRYFWKDHPNDYHVGERDDGKGNKSNISFFKNKPIASFDKICYKRKVFEGDNWVTYLYPSLMLYNTDITGSIDNGDILIPSKEDYDHAIESIKEIAKENGCSLTAAEKKFIKRFGK